MIGLPEKQPREHFPNKIALLFRKSVKLVRPEEYVRIRYEGGNFDTTELHLLLGAAKILKIDLADGKKVPPAKDILVFGARKVVEYYVPCREYFMAKRAAVGQALEEHATKDLKDQRDVIDKIIWTADVSFSSAV